MAEIVRQAQAIKNIIALLIKEFDCKVYSDEVRENFQKPCFFIVRRKGMSKPPVKLGVDKSHLIEKERTS